MRKMIAISLVTLSITGYSIEPIMAGDLYRWIDPSTGRTMLNPSLPAYPIKEKRIVGTLADGKIILSMYSSMLMLRTSIQK
jgi:hypothetical protein